MTGRMTFAGEFSEKTPFRESDDDAEANRIGKSNRADNFCSLFFEYDLTCISPFRRVSEHRSSDEKRST